MSAAEKEAKTFQVIKRYQDSKGFYKPESNLIEMFSELRNEAGLTEEDLKNFTGTQISRFDFKNLMINTFIKSVQMIKTFQINSEKTKNIKLAFRPLFIPDCLQVYEIVGTENCKHGDPERLGFADFVYFKDNGDNETISKAASLGKKIFDENRSEYGFEGYNFGNIRKDDNNFYPGEFYKTLIVKE